VNLGGCIAVRKTFPVLEIVELDAQACLCDFEGFESGSVCPFDFANRRTAAPRAEQAPLDRPLQPFVRGDLLDVIYG
jgi:hypothetical protein